MVEPLRRRQTKEAANGYAGPNATAPHLNSTRLRRGGPIRPSRDAASEACFRGQTSTTPCATAHGVRDTMLMASSKSAASIMAKPATGNDDAIKGPVVVSTSSASGLRTWTGAPAIPINTPSFCIIAMRRERVLRCEGSPQCGRTHLGRHIQSSRIWTRLAPSRVRVTKRKGHVAMRRRICFAIFAAGLFVSVSLASAAETENCDLAQISTSRELHNTLGRRAVDIIERASRSAWRTDARLADLVSPSARFSLGVGDVVRPTGTGIEGARALDSPHECRHVSLRRVELLGFDR